MKTYGLVQRKGRQVVTPTNELYYEDKLVVLNGYYENGKGFVKTGLFCPVYFF